MSPAKREAAIYQVAALPYRDIGDGVMVMLITSRQTGRWVVPKGNLMVGKAPHEAAAIEAKEEAGVCGTASPVPLGHYRYRKMYADGRSVIAEVDVYPLSVTDVRKKWIEMDQRERRWFTTADAATAVDEVELGEMIHRFGEGLGPRPAV